MEREERNRKSSQTRKLEKNREETKWEKQKETKWRKR